MSCRPLSVSLFIIVLGVILSVPAQAQTPVCTAPATQDQIAVAPGDSSVVVVWRDSRFDPANPYDIFASRLNYYLSALWSPVADGADECNAAGSQTEPAVAIGPDSITWVSWRDYRTCALGQVMVQAIAPTGSALCQVNGRVLTSASCDDGMRNHAIVASSPGSAIVVWHHKYDTGAGGQTYDEILTQKVSASTCGLQWGSNGTRIYNHGFGQASGTSTLIPYAVSDGSGGILVVWYYADRLYARRVDSAGNVLWAAPVRICATEVTQQNPSLATDGSGGAIVTWQQGNAGSRTILAQRIDANGVLQWGAAGKVIAGPGGGDLVNPQVVRSTLGRSFVVWEADYALPNSDILVQRINFLGDTLAARIPICTAPYGQTVPRGAAGPNGSCYIVWQDGRDLAIGDDADVYAQRLDDAGNVQCAVDGTPIAGSPGIDEGRQYNPRVVPVAIGGWHALAVWSDTRNGTPDIYATPICDNDCMACGVLAVWRSAPAGLTNVMSVPNPFSRATRIRFQLAQQSRVDVRVYDVSGRLVRTLVSSERMESGEHEVEWNGLTESGSRATPGVYLCRLTTGPQVQANRMVFVK